MRVSGLCAAVAAVFLVVSQAQASVIVDESPAALGGIPMFGYNNNSAGQNFLVEFTLAQTTALTGMDIYTVSGWAALGDSVTMRLRDVVGSQPAATNLAEITTVVDALDSNGAGTSTFLRTHADFGPITLGPGSYFIGMSGAGYDISWGNTTANSQTIWQLSDETPNALPPFNIGNLPLRIYGDPVSPAPIPEPLTLSLFAAGLLGALRRPRKRNGRPFPL